jgi:hypothetical protein
MFEVMVRDFAKKVGVASAAQTDRKQKPATRP